LKKITPLAGFLAKCALVCSAALLLSNLPFTSTRAHNAWLSSLPLALGGIAYAVLQIRLRPDRVVLVKRLILAASFICWAIDQVLPAGPMATFIGDAVVSAYVLDYSGPELNVPWEYTVRLRGCCRPGRRASDRRGAHRVERERNDSYGQTPGRHGLPYRVIGWHAEVYSLLNWSNALLSDSFWCCSFEAVNF